MYFSKEKTSKIKAYSIYFQLNNNRTQVSSDHNPDKITGFCQQLSKAEDEEPF